MALSIQALLHTIHLLYSHPQQMYPMLLLKTSPLPKRVLGNNFQKRKSSMSAILTSTQHKIIVKASKNKAMQDQKKQSYKHLRKKLFKKSCSNVDHYICLVFGDNTDEDWIQCYHCGKWAHEACADINDPKFYFHDNCNI